MLSLFSLYHFQNKLIIDVHFIKEYQNLIFTGIGNSIMVFSEINKYKITFLNVDKKHAFFGIF